MNKTDIVNKASSAATAYFNQAKPKDVVIATLQVNAHRACRANRFPVVNVSGDARPAIASSIGR